MADLSSTNIFGELNVTGKIKAGGDVIAYYSDGRLKEDIVPLDDPLGRLSHMRGVFFSWTEDALSMGIEPKAKRESGIIAQEVEKGLADAVAPAPFNNEYLTVQKERLVPLLIEATKELEQRNSNLEYKLEQAINRIDELEKKLTEEN